MNKIDTLRDLIKHENYFDAFKTLGSFVSIKKSPWHDLEVCQIALECLIKSKMVNLSTKNDIRNNFFNDSLFQFWDSKIVPDDVLFLINEWKSINSNNIYFLFNDDSAREFILANFPDDVVSAYDLAYHPAMKSDIFRLCYVYITGSLYIDADEKCLLPVSTWLPSGFDFFASFEVVNGKYSIGNKFFYAEKKSPIVFRSIEIAVNEILSCDCNNVKPNIWLTTGPGNLSRSYIQCYFNSNKINSLLVPDDELEMYVKWMSLDYQNTRLNWRNS
jgi:hypothetical protein